MNQFYQLNSQTKDFIIYSMAVVVSFSICWVNYQTQKQEQQLASNYTVNDLLVRIDSASALLNTWSRLDVNQ